MVSMLALTIAFINKKYISKPKSKFTFTIMGKVRIKIVKESAKKLIEQHYNKVSSDFQHNKKMIEELGQFPSLAFRNRVAGYLTRLHSRLAKGPIKGVSLKMHEEAKERKLIQMSHKTFGVTDLKKFDELPKHIRDSMLMDFPKHEEFIMG